MFNTADVLVYIHPVVHLILIEDRLVISGIAVSEEVPG